MLPPAIESIPKDIACNLLNLQIKDTPMLLQNQNLVAYLFIYLFTKAHAIYIEINIQEWWFKLRKKTKEIRLEPAITSKLLTDTKWVLLLLYLYLYIYVYIYILLFFQLYTYVREK